MVGVIILDSALKEQHESDCCRTRAWPEVKRVLVDGVGWLMRHRLAASHFPELWYLGGT